MSKIELLIVEDDFFKLKALKEYCEEAQYITYIAQNKEEVIKIINERSIDLAIIDSYLHNKPDGIKIGEFISELGVKKFPFLFLTNTEDRKIFDRARVLYPANFLLKAFKPLELNYAIELTIGRALEDDHNFNFSGYAGAALINENFLFKMQERLFKITSSEIIYITVDGRNCFLITTLGSFLVQTSLKKLLPLLNPKLFIQTHRNYVINVCRVKELIPSENMVIMDNEKAIFISSRMKAEFLKNYNLLK